jgi:flagellar protein FliO/FliZ
MEVDSYLRFILALLLVLGLLALAAWLLRRSGYGAKLGRSRRLAAVESLPLGPRHRLMLVRRDGIEHLLLLGPHGDTVVERNISSHAVMAQGQTGSADMPEEKFADLLRGARDRGQRENMPDGTAARDSHSRKDQS